MNESNKNGLSSVSRFIDAFFTGLRNNTAKRFLDNASKKGVHSEIIDKLREMEKQNRELESIIKKYSK